MFRLIHAERKLPGCLIYLVALAVLLGLALW